MTAKKKKVVKKLPQLVKDDGWLEPYTEEIQRRVDTFKSEIKRLKEGSGGLKKFAEGHRYLGFNYDKKKKGWWYREWAPGAKALTLIGDFNSWDREANPLTRLDNGIWELFLPDESYGEKLKHDSSLKVHIETSNSSLDRIPAYIKRAVQPKGEVDYVGRFWDPKPFAWTDNGYSPLTAWEMPLIYECHIGMAQEKEGIGTYREFADNVLPRIKDLGYNVIQTMAIQEHPYYGSFGYHVSNFFAVSSRFGTPDDFKYLVNKAHELEIAVVMDLVHSHAVKNVAEGLNEFDGTEDQYFHSGGRGYHNAWDSKLFDYGKPEVRQFLLSNVRFWIEEYHIDGFRFDGVTSMMYHHHGDHTSFDHYDKYFASGVDWDNLLYLQLANELAHALKPGFITIAEDMSGMPGLCRPQKDGGIGFDFRLGMGLPDYWIKVLKEKKDEDWNVNELWGTMSNRRYGERTIAYAESHDQAIVGDKTVAFWLMDKEMYSHMHKDYDSLVIDRGMALHKMIRFFTMVLGGEGYLNFIGNEFGHPEWIDFPREGNDWSYKYARRQWSLVEHSDLRYQFLNNFDRAMIHLVDEFKVLSALPAQQLNLDQNNLTAIFERNNLIFVFNFHWANSIPDYRFRVPNKGDYEIILNSDDQNFGGFGRIDSAMSYPAVELMGEYFLSLYVPNRTCLVLKKQ